MASTEELQTELKAEINRYPGKQLRHEIDRLIQVHGPNNSKPPNNAETTKALGKICQSLIGKSLPQNQFDGGAFNFEIDNDTGFVDGGLVEDDFFKYLQAETDKLAQTQVANKGTGLKQLVAKAMADGYPENYAVQIAKKVQKRLNNTETGNVGHATGVAHNPVDRYTAIKKRLQIRD